jgi:hypothetical protein
LNLINISHETHTINVIVSIIIMVPFCSFTQVQKRILYTTHGEFVEGTTVPYDSTTYSFYQSNVEGVINQNEFKVHLNSGFELSPFARMQYFNELPNNNQLLSKPNQTVRTEYEVSAADIEKTYELLAYNNADNKEDSTVKIAQGSKSEITRSTYDINNRLVNFTLEKTNGITFDVVEERIYTYTVNGAPESRNVISYNNGSVVNTSYDSLTYTNNLVSAYFFGDDANTLVTKVDFVYNGQEIDHLKLLDDDNGTFVESVRFQYEYSAGNISSVRYQEITGGTVSQDSLYLEEYTYTNGKISLVETYSDGEQSGYKEISYDQDGFATQILQYIQGASDYYLFGKTVMNYEKIAGLNELTANEILFVYPNPVQAELSIDGVNNETFTIMSMEGKVVSIGTTNGSINVNDLINGIYYLEIGLKRTKFVKN